jgi:hypothetical protein
VKMLTADQVARLGNVPRRTVQDWATAWVTKGEGPGPRAYRLGPQITRYRLDDVAAWLQVEPGAIQVTEVA